MKKYFFGYLFVRLAKWLAVLLLVVGIGRTVYQYRQTALHAERVRYQDSYELRQRLGDLRAEWERSQRLASRFRTFPAASPAAAQVNFPAAITSEGDFEKLFLQLATVESGRDAMKRGIVERLEEMTTTLETKLRAHAAALAKNDVPKGQAAPPSRQTQPAPEPTTTEPENLFERLSSGEIEERIDVLRQAREFLRVLETGAENPENRKMLSASADEISTLEKLLPAPFSAPAPRLEAPAAQPVTEEPTPKLQAERVADQLAHLRAATREAVLTSWRLDSALSTTQQLAHDERERCRVATLAIESLWLDAAGSMALSAGLGLLAAFLVLVFADLLQTFFDTATNTGIAAEYITRTQSLSTPISQQVHPHTLPNLGQPPRIPPN